MKDTDLNVLGMSNILDTDNTNYTLLLFEKIGYETYTFRNDSEDDINSKMDHLMHSDTMILIAGLVVMIFVGLAFRSICLRLSSKNNRKELVRGGLKEMARHMDHVTRAMSNDLELPDSPKTVIRTYSNYGGRGQPVEKKSEKGGPIRNSLRVQAFSNTLKLEMENQESQNYDNSFSLEMHSFGRGER